MQRHLSAHIGTMSDMMVLEAKHVRIRSYRPEAEYSLTCRPPPPSPATNLAPIKAFMVGAAAHAMLPTAKIPTEMSMLACLPMTLHNRP